MKTIGYTEMGMAHYFQKKILVLLPIIPTRQYLLIGDVFEILSHGAPNEPGKRIVPVECAYQFGQPHIN